MDVVLGVKVGIKECVRVESEYDGRSVRPVLDASIDADVGVKVGSNEDVQTEVGGYDVRSL
jgi:hypothetical protein